MGMTTRPRTSEQGRKVEVVWTTISYRTIISYATLVLLLLGFIFYLIAPNYFGQKVRALLSAVSGGMVRTAGSTVAPAKREAHFVNLDGTVNVRKAQAMQWIRADYNTNLDTGDSVRTGGDGVARIIFSDGTNYLIRPDSLIVVEESGEDPVTKATRVAVQVSSGTVDLATGKFEVLGSTSKIAFEDAVANLGEESRAVVQNDPKTNVHQLTLDRGAASVTRGATTVHLGQNEKVSFSAGQPGLIPQKVIAPPNLIAPVKMALMISKDPRKTPITFRWSPVAGAAGYHLMVSPSGMFSNLVVDKRIKGSASTEIAGLDEGIYYWEVESIDRKGVESQPSAANRFNIVQQAASDNQAFLEITQMIQHGRLVEVVGRTEPGSTVIINNEQVFNIQPDGTFRFFTAPLPSNGLNQITITAQDRKGNTKTIRKTVVVE